MSKINVFADPTGNHPTQKYIVRLKEMSSRTQSAQRRTTQQFNSFDAISLELTMEQVNYITNNNLVESIEVDKPIQIAANEKVAIVEEEIRDQSQTTPWGVHATGAYLTDTMLGPDGETVKVAVFDTGINEHSDLTVTDAVYFVDSADTYGDDNGHGTHIAGTIAAENNLTGVVGLASQVELYSVKVLDSSGYGYTSSVIEGLEWAVNNEVDIINMSFVSQEYSESLHEAIQAARLQGILIIGAAGNGGPGEDTIQYPARYPEVVAVGAVDKSHRRANFSSTGPDLDLVAPGVDILSTMANGAYGTFSGTSQAAAHVTGAAALLWSKESSLSADEVVERLTSSATELGTAEEYGSGMINVARALGVISDPIAPIGYSPAMEEGKIWVPQNNTDLEIASYGKYGSGMSYEPGESATVGLKLEGDQNGENIHTQIIIEVFAAADPDTILASATRYNPQLDQDIQFTWHIPSNAVAGQYFIRYHYPAVPSGNWDDYFDIYVTQPGPGPDTYEPNNTLETAYIVSPGNTYISYLSSSSDTDYYKLFAPANGMIDIELMVPGDKDYDLQIYDEDGYIIAYSPEGVGQREHLTIELEEGRDYYFRVFGYSGSFGADPYALIVGNIDEIVYLAPTGLLATPSGNQIKLTWDAMVDAVSYQLQLNGQAAGMTDVNTYTFTDLEPLQSYTLGVAAVYTDGVSAYSTIEATTTILELFLNQPVDLIAQSDQMLTFTPPTTGIYKIFTEAYQGQGTPSDTVLNVYTDMAKTQLLFTNDDTGSSPLSELRMNLVGGQTYYVELSWLEVGERSARITAEVLQSEIPYITLNQPVDIDELSLDSSTVYVFIPSTSGPYKITTDYFNGIATSRENDTVIEVFSDVSLSDPVSNGYNDDRLNSLFSGVSLSLTRNVPYYIRVKEASDTGVLARLLVSSAGDNGYIPLSAGQEALIDLDQNQEALYKFTPTESGAYRLFTSRLSNSTPMADTVIELYSDPGLQDLLALNDDGIGNAPYGASYSKIEMSLTAGETYYMLVRSYDARRPLQTKLMIEDMENGTKTQARSIDWGEVISVDAEGRPLTINSLYDTDYYRIELTQAEQVYISTSAGIGMIEDINGNLFGYFTQGGDSVFNLPAGTYYLRVQDNFFGRDSLNVPPYTYELTVEINQIEYVSEADPDFGAAMRSTLAVTAGCSSSNQYLDATPGDECLDKVQWQYKNKSNSVSLIVEIYAPTIGGDWLVYTDTIAGAKSKGDITTISWDGKVTKNVSFVALMLSTPLGPYYYAKDGFYNIYVKEVSASGGQKMSQVASVTVNNNPLESVNWIPLPPKYGTIKGKKIEINASNKQSCWECRTYYFRYIMSPNEAVPETAYDYWSKQMYGYNGLEQFWNIAEQAIIYNPNLTPVENLQRTLDIAGMVPVWGEGADAVNGAIYLIRGENAEALLSFAAVVPVIGTVKSGRDIIGLVRVNRVMGSCLELDCMKAAYTNLPYTAKTKRLRTELLKILTPPVVPGIKRWDAHHIIPKGKKYADLHLKLQQAGIDLHSAANGVFLPVKSRTSSITFEQIEEGEVIIEWTVASHRNHTKNYVQYIRERLDGRTTREQILHEIQEIRNLLLSGEIDLVMKQ